MFKKLFTKQEVVISIVSLVLGSLIVAVMAWYSITRNMDFGDLSRDILSVLNGGYYIGILSNIGITLWGIAAVSFWMGWYYSRTYQREKIETKISLYFALLSSLLYLDDFFMLHERMIGYFLGLPEESLTVFYFAVVIFMIIRYFKNLQANGLIFIVLSFGFLGLSGVIDLAEKFMHIPYEQIIEDGAKFLGICMWLTFAMSYSTKVIRSGVKRS